MTRGSRRRSPSRRPRCPTRWPAVTSSAGHRPARARPWASPSPSSAGWPAGRRSARGRAAWSSCPTRELATQVTEVLKPLARAMDLWVTTIYGGVSYGPQVNALQRRTDIVVATPGRLADLIGQGECDLSDVEITVIDEADQMADLGFLPIVRRLLETTPDDGQRMLFSATLDAAIDVLARRFLHDPVLHSVDENSSPAEIEHHVLTVERREPRRGHRRAGRRREAVARVHQDQARGGAARPPADRGRHPGRRAARQPAAGRPVAEPRRVRLRPRPGHGRHRHRRPRHPHRRHRPGHPRRPARPSTRPTCTAPGAPPGAARTAWS